MGANLQEMFKKLPQVSEILESEEILKAYEEYPESLIKLIEQFQKLPTIGKKSAERLAMSIVGKDEESVEDFSKALLEVKSKIHPCKICGNLTEDEICGICKDVSREENIICVIEDVRNLYAIEKSSVFHGKYHILGGLISPSDNVKAEDLSIDKLLDRIDKENIKEVILAISSTIEGETTSLFLAHLLENKNVKVSKIASGIPVG